jgi:hypothetical protein
MVGPASPGFNIFDPGGRTDCGPYFIGSCQYTFACVKHSDQK